MNGNVNMKQMTNILKKNGNDLNVLHELIVPKYDNDIFIKVYKEKAEAVLKDNKNDSLAQKDQFWLLCNNDLIPFKSIEHLIIISEHKYIPISGILEIAQVCNLSRERLHQHSYYNLQYQLFNELNRITPEKLKEVVIELLFKRNDVIRTDSDAMLFLDSITSSPHFNYQYVNMLIELCQPDNQKNPFIYEICASIIHSKLMNQENIVVSKEAHLCFDKIFKDYFLTIKTIDLQHIGFVCTLLKSPLLTKEQYEKIVDKVKTMEKPIDFVLLEKVFNHPYVSKELIDWMIDESKIHYTDVFLNVSNLNENQLMKLYEKRLKQYNITISNQKISSDDKEEFWVRYHALHSKQINDDYVQHPNPTIRQYVALSQYLKEEQINSLIMDNDVEVLVNLVISHILSEDQLDKLIDCIHSQKLLNKEEIEHINCHIVSTLFLSDEQRLEMILSKSYWVQLKATLSNNLNKEQLDVLLRSDFEVIRQMARKSLIYALNYQTLDSLMANKKYNKINDLMISKKYNKINGLLTKLIKTLIPIK